MNSSPNNPCMLWSCVARNEVILAEATVPSDSTIGSELVAEAACQLLQKKATPGWEYSNLRRQRATGALKGIKFHVYYNQHLIQIQTILNKTHQETTAGKLIQATFKELQRAAGWTSELHLIPLEILEDLLPN